LRTFGFFGSGKLPPAQKRVLRPSGGSEGMLNAVVFKQHQSVLRKHFADELEASASAVLH
jgi:hypothetical protein